MIFSLTGVRGGDTELCKDSTDGTGDVRAIPRSRHPSHCIPARRSAGGVGGGDGGDGTQPLDGGDRRTWR